MARHLAAAAPSGPRMALTRSMQFLAAFFAVISITAIGLAVYRQLDHPVRTIGIHGVERADQRQQVMAIAAERVRGGVLSVSPSGLAADLGALEWVRTARVRRVWPDQLQIDIDTHSVIARWRDGLLADDGTPLQPDKPVRLDGLPSLAGPDGSEKSVMERFLTARSLLADTGIQLVALRLDERGQWTLEFAPGIAVELGDRDFVDRLGRVVQVWRSPLLELSRVARFDARYDNGVAVGFHAVDPPAAEAPGRQQS